MKLFNFLKYFGIFLILVNLLCMLFFIDLSQLKIPLKSLFLILLLTILIWRAKFVLKMGILFITIYLIIYIVDIGFTPSADVRLSINYYVCRYFYFDWFSEIGKFLNYLSFVWLILFYSQLFSKEAKVFYKIKN